jgi:cellulose synthase/poly-beta-1,6-N-acetylglucosamine synthase-like glycosyltransferase
LAQSGQNQHPRCSVVIPTYKRAADLDRCLEAVSRQEYDRYDVIVVDNSPGDPETRAIAEKWGARYVREQKKGLCRARNRGALVSAAEIIAYLDDDSVPEPQWLAGLAKAFEDDAVMAVGGKTIPLEVTSDAARVFAQIRGSAYNRPVALSVDQTSPYWFEISGFGGISPGCNMAVRRKAFEVWPGFHERIGRGTPVYGGDEQYAFFSLVKLGYKVAYTPDAVVKHPFPPTMDELRNRYLRDLTASTAYFTMLLVEEAGHRMNTLRYMWEATLGKERTWRGDIVARPRVVSRARSALALMLGPIKYVQGLVAAAYE